MVQVEGSIPTNVKSLFYSKIPFGADYIMFPTGDNVYSCMVHIPFPDKTIQYTVIRTGSGYGYDYTLTSFEADSFEYTVDNELYVYSNVGVGIRENLPIGEDIQTFSSLFVVLLLLFFVIFGRVFGWKRRTLL